MDRKEFIPQSFKIEHSFSLTKNSQKQLYVESWLMASLVKEYRSFWVLHKTSAKYLLYFKMPML